MIKVHEHLCPKCHSSKLKTWEELTDDEKLLAKSLPPSAEFTLNERKKHRFCTRCWSEQIADTLTAA